MINWIDFNKSFIFAQLKNTSENECNFSAEERTRKNEHELSFLEQAAGGPTWWGLRGPVGPRGLLHENCQIIMRMYNISEQKNLVSLLKRKVFKGN